MKKGKGKKEPAVSRTLEKKTSAGGRKRAGAEKYRKKIWKGTGAPGVGGQAENQKGSGGHVCTKSHPGRGGNALIKRSLREAVKQPFITKKYKKSGILIILRPLL